MKPFDVYHLSDIELRSAEGSYVKDINGREYLDFYGGHAVISIGHSQPYFVSRLQEQVAKIAFYSNSVIIAEQLSLAEKLGSLSGLSRYRLFLCNSGAEANENALKLAAFRTGRRKVIAFKGAFHGRTSLAVELTDNPAIQSPLNKSGQVLHLPLNDIEAFDQVISEEFAAVIVEGIQGVAGIVEPEPGFLKHIALRCKEFGCMLILDEVQSGLGRSGQFFAFNQSGICPDLITMAKGIGNGFPVAAVLISPDFDEVKEQLGTTFGGSYLACTAANAVLDIIEKEKLVENADRMGKILKQELLSLKGLKEYRGRGLMIGLEFDFPVRTLRKTLMEKHAVLAGASSNPYTLRLLPALNIGERETDQLLTAISKALEDV